MSAVRAGLSRQTRTYGELLGDDPGDALGAVLALVQVDQPPRLIEVLRDRLLADDVLARLPRLLNHGGLDKDRQGEDHGRDVGPGEQRGEIVLAVGRVRGGRARGEGRVLERCGEEGCRRGRRARVDGFERQRGRERERGQVLPVSPGASATACVGARG